MAEIFSDVEVEKLLQDMAAVSGVTPTQIANLRRSIEEGKEKAAKEKAAERIKVFQDEARPCINTDCVRLAAEKYDITKGSIRYDISERLLEFLLVGEKAERPPGVTSAERLKAPVVIGDKCYESAWAAARASDWNTLERRGKGEEEIRIHPTTKKEYDRNSWKEYAQDRAKEQGLVVQSLKRGAPCPPGTTPITRADVARKEVQSI